ncbi:MAG: site-2 protease family protein [Planctomycetia bacterium]
MIVLLVLVFSVLLRELSHVLVWQRQRIGTVTLWPLGGVSSDPAISIKLRQALLHTLAGSMVSLGVAAVCGGYLFQNGLLTQVWMVPLRFPDTKLADDLAIRCLQFSVLINWNLAILNLLPVDPLDGGHILQGWLSLRFRELVVRDIVTRTGMVLCIAGLIAGLVFDLSSVAALSGCLLLMMMDAHRWLEPDLFAELEQRMHQQNPYGDDDDDDHDDDDDDLFSRFRLDFHNKHTEEDGPRPSGNAFADRPTHSVRAEENASGTDQDAVDEANVDQILSKLHEFGRHSLTAQELGMLNRFSARLRQRKVRG